MTKPLPFVSIILPTFNERENITGLVLDLDRCVSYRKEIIVVDDNSPDGTADALRKLKRKYPRLPVRIIVRITDHGLVPSLNDGIRSARGSIISWLDADFSHPPEVLEQLIKKVAEGNCDAAIASRFIKGGKQKQAADSESRSAILASTFLNTVLTRIMKLPVTDFTSGFIAVRKKLLTGIRLNGSYGEYFLPLVVHLTRKRAHICEIGYTSAPRRYGVSKTAPSFKTLISHGINYVAVILSLWLKKR
jgi:dolichol-phosphate mannosyltransferase